MTVPFRDYCPLFTIETDIGKSDLGGSLTSGRHERDTADGGNSGMASVPRWPGIWVGVVQEHLVQDLIGKIS